MLFIVLWTEDSEERHQIQDKVKNNTTLQVQVSNSVNHKERFHPRHAKMVAGQTEKDGETTGGVK